jgi:threonine 3-dehydrogenase
MLALTFDRNRESWDSSTGLVLEEVERPYLDVTKDAGDRSGVIIKVLYAGFCGSDRGIWWRKAFGDMIESSLNEDGNDKRIVGHELLGEVVDLGERAAEKYGLKVGDIVSTESHIICGACYQCRLGDSHVCAKDKIIGISQDGCFAEYIKLPAKALWPTDITKIRPEVAAVQEPFGNAVHACQVRDLRGKSVVVIGCGTIGLFAILIARGMGASKVIGVEMNPKHAEMARKLGCDEVFTPKLNPDNDWGSDPELVAKIMEYTDGVGADVVLEMAGFNSAFNNALKCVRSGGDVVAFGVKNGDMVIEDGHRIVMNGIQIHGVVGRQIFRTWEITRNLLENRNNGIHDAVWEVILNKGEGTIVDISDWEKDSFEKMISNNPKVVIRFS